MLDTEPVQYSFFLSGPPTSVQLSGPVAVHHNSEYVYQCRVGGGQPRPEVRWSVRDHLGNTREVAGDWMEEGVARMILETQDVEKKLEITCAAENPSGRASHTISVHTHCKYSYNIKQVLLMLLGYRSSYFCPY